MRSIKNNNEEVYQFIGGDTNPTVKKVDYADGYTNDIYNKDDIISTLNKAVKANLITKSLKIVYENAENIRYEFFVKADNSVIKILIPDPDFHNNGILFTHHGIEAQFKGNVSVVPYIKVEDRYITELDKISKDIVMVKLKKNLKALEQIIAGTMTLATLAAGLYMASSNEQDKEQPPKKELQNLANYSQNAKNNTNNSNIERIVDEAINNNLDDIKSRGRKL